MKKRLEINKVVFFLVLTMILQIMIPLTEINVQASSHDDIIKSLNLSKDRLTSKNETFAIEARWEISQDGSAKTGDNFVLKLPEDFDISRLRGKLPLIGSDGHIYGEGSIDKGNKSINFVFTDEVEKRNNIWGEFRIDGIMIDLKDPDPDKGIAKQDYEITSNLGSSYQVPIEVNHDLYTDVDTGLNESGQTEPHRKKNFDKIGQIHTGEEDTMYWYVYVNGKEASERVNSQLFVEDILGPGHTITESDFSITLTDRSNDNESGIVLKEGTDLFNKYISNFKMQEDRKGYSFNFNPLAEGGQAKALRIYYHTVIDDDAPFDQTIFENYFNLDSSDGQKVGVPEEVDFGSMMGTGYGIENRTGKFKLFKTDEDGQPIKQAGIKFKLEVMEGKDHYYNRDMEPITIITDENGIASIDGIYSGYYTVTEILAPDGYILSNKPENILLNFSDLETTKEALKASSDEIKRLLDEKKARPDIEDYYNNLIDIEEKSTIKLERKLEKLLKQGIEFSFKNEKIDLIDLSTKKRWIGSPESEDVKSEIYLLRKYLKYDENDNFQMIEEEVPNSRKEISYSEEDQLIEWKELPTSDQFKNNYQYFIVEEESQDFQMEHIFEDGELVIVNRFPNEEPAVIEPGEPDPEEPEEPETPEEPEEPETPEEPEEPKTPEEPEEPETPEEPEEPETPEEPEEPETPEEPEEPETPEEPEEPETPEEPEEPETPEEPEKPETPEEPEEPKTPEEPEEPETPEEPEEPKTPEEPEEPETPEEPEEPKTPEEPKKPETPKEPEEPKTPEKPEKAETPKKPEEPKTLEKPKENDTPKKPEEPKKSSIKIERVPRNEDEVIEVELIKDGKVISEKPLILDKSNNWSGDFEGLDSGVLSDYSIKAVTSDGKELKIEAGVKGFMIVEEEPDFAVASKSDTQSDGPIDLLPQTGELPYTKLYLAGLALTIIGLITRKKRFK